MLDVEDALTATADKAFRLTRFYAEVYESEPADASEIPYISDSDYHRAAGLLDCDQHRVVDPQRSRKFDGADDG